MGKYRRFPFHAERAQNDCRLHLLANSKMAAPISKNIRDELLDNLAKRREKEETPFEEITGAYTRTFETLEALRYQYSQAVYECEKFKQELYALQLHVDGGGSVPTGKATDKIRELEHRLFKAQEELTDIHRRKAENAQLVIDLNTAVHEKEKTITQHKTDITSKDTELQTAQSEILRLDIELTEVKSINKMFHDETNSYSLQVSTLEERNRNLEDDNRTVTQRLLALKSQMADKLNFENELFAMRRDQKIQQELKEASTTLGVGEVTSKQTSTSPTPILPMTMPGVARLKFEAHDGEVNAVQFCPSGKYFATGGSDRKVKLWEWSDSSCTMIGMLTGSNAGINSLEFDCNESYILGASNDFASRIWTIADHRIRHTLTGHSGKVLSAKFLGDASKIVSGSHDRTLKLWDLRNRSCTRTIFAGSACNDLVTVTGSQFGNIISGHFDKRLRFWDVRVGSSTNEIILNDKITSLHISPDTLQLLACCKDNCLKTIDLRMNKVIQTYSADGFKVAYDWTRAIYSPDGQYVVAGSQDGGVYLWNTTTTSIEKITKEHTSQVIACSWHCTSSTLLTTERNKKVIIWTNAGNIM